MYTQLNLKRKSGFVNSVTEKVKIDGKDKTGRKYTHMTRLKLKKERNLEIHQNNQIAEKE